MDRAEEIKIGQGIKISLERIRDVIFTHGISAAYHIGKASDFLKDRDSLERHVSLDENETGEYLNGLADLIAKARSQDQKCAQLWNSQQTASTKEEYLSERSALASILAKFRFNLKVYERLVRQPIKRDLEEARRLLSSKRNQTEEARLLEARFRMSLQEFVSSEETILDNLQQLDVLRYKYFEAHKSFAIKKAAEFEGDSASRAALFGLKKAADNYEAERGYRFTAYAQHWIDTAIQRRKGTETTLPLPVPESLKMAEVVFENYVLPSVAFELVKSGQVLSGASKLGGKPDLPDDFDWPENEGRKLDFLLQLRLSDLSAFKIARMFLPYEGVLFFFYDLDKQPWGYDPGRLNGFCVRLFPEPSALKPCAVPDPEYALPEFGLHFYQGYSLPCLGSRAFNRLCRSMSLTKTLGDDYSDYSLRLAKTGASRPAGGRHQLFGYSQNIQGDMQLEAQLVTNGIDCGRPEGYRDPRRNGLEQGAEDWVLLLQLDSDDLGGFMWGDCGMLYYWIRSEDLKECRFDAVWMTLQCY